MQARLRPHASLCLIAASLALQGCAEPRIEFRGYSDRSSCAEIIDAELANGAVFQGAYESEDLENPGYVTELLGTIFEERVRIDIQCDVRGFISSIHYLSLASDPRDTNQVYSRFSDELETLFGIPTEIVTDTGRSRRYLCHSPSPVLIDEWRLEPASDTSANVDAEAVEHEIYLAVMPRVADCLDEQSD